MIEEKFVDLYARNSGLKDKLIAERDVVLAYALDAIHAAGLAGALAFKGGTCLRKCVFGSSGRFSEDLDFTLTGGKGALERIMAMFGGEHHGIKFRIEESYAGDDGTSWGALIGYEHAWNSLGRFKLQVSLREEPTLPVVPLPQKRQAYFKYLEFAPAAAPALQVIEMTAEKLRAACQRVKVRDLYDLCLIAELPFDVDLLRSLVVLKLWQSGDPFDPDRFFDKIGGTKYDWTDLERLLRSNQKLVPSRILEKIRGRYAALRGLTSLEQTVAKSARGRRNKAAAEKLRGAARELFSASA